MLTSVNFQVLGLIKTKSGILCRERSVTKCIFWLDKLIWEERAGWYYAEPRALNLKFKLAYVKFPGDGAVFGVWLDLTWEINIVTFNNIFQVKRLS